MPDLNLKGEESEWGAPAQEAEPQQRKKRWLILLFGGVLLVLVVAFFFFESKIFQPEGSRVTESKSSITVGTDSMRMISKLIDSVAADSAALQTSVQSLQMLPESTIVTRVDSATESTLSGFFTIQLSAWQSESRARGEVKRLQDVGLDVYLTKSEPDSIGKVWHRVRMGHYGTLEKAKRVAERFLDTLVVGYTFEKEN